MKIALIPPVELCDLCHAVVVEPLTKAEWDEEMDVRMCFGELTDSWLL